MWTPKERQPLKHAREKIKNKKVVKKENNKKLWNVV